MEFNENKPIYLQLADQIMDDAERNPSIGRTRLCSVREYAAKTGVNANTVMRTYTWLQQEDIIYNQRGIGYFYAEDAHEKVLKMRRQTFFNQDLHYFMERLAAMRISPEEFGAMYADYLDKQK